MRKYFISTLHYTYLTVISYIYGVVTLRNLSPHNNFFARRPQEVPQRYVQGDISMKTLPLLLCFVFLWAGCAPTDVNKFIQKTGAAPMAPKEVLKLVDGNTLYLQSFAEDSYLFFDHSGQLFGKDIYTNKDTGKWDVSEDGELCIRMSSWWYGDLLCFQVLNTDGTLHLANTSGVMQYSVQHYAGDAKGLYHKIRGKKTSYRRSLRAQQTPKTPASEPVASSDQKTSKPEKSITEDPSFSSMSAEKDLRSTVKWMARDCPGCNLADANLSKAELIKANLAGANLAGANLRMAQLRRANLEGADLEGADLSYANLPGANLKNAHLAGAKLKGANLIRADLTGADLRGTDLSEALLEGVRGLQR